MPTRAQVIAAKIKQYDAQITGLQDASIDSAIAKLAVAQLVDASLGGGGGGGAGGATEATLQAILAVLQDILTAQTQSRILLQQLNTSQSQELVAAQSRVTIERVQDLVIGPNTIVHNLGLPSPFTSTIDIVDNALGTIINAPISANSANSLVISTPIAYQNVRITIKS